MVLNKSLIKKQNLYILKKRFIEKIDINQIQRNEFPAFLGHTFLENSLGASNVLHIKSSVYFLLKELKRRKRGSLVAIQRSASLDSLEKFCFKLEASGFYTSFSEKSRNNLLLILKEKIRNFKVYGFLNLRYGVDLSAFHSSFSNNFFFNKSVYRDFRKKYLLLKSDLVSQRMEEPILLKDLVRLKKKYSHLTESRLFLYMSTYKKKYTRLFRLLRRNKLNVRRLFSIFKTCRLNYTIKKKKKYKLYKRMTWKWKKKKRRKKVGLFYFLRKRPRMLFRFYVPRHLEINYKTFSLAHLGLLNLPSINARIGFWLNLRRLLTFLAL